MSSGSQAAAIIYSILPFKGFKIDRSRFEHSRLLQEDLAGLPAALWTIESLRQTKAFEHLIFVTDSPELRELCAEHGVDTVFITPEKSVASSKPRSLGEKTAVRRIKERLGRLPTILHASAEYPFICPATYKDAVNLSLESSHVVSSGPVVPFDTRFWCDREGVAASEDGRFQAGYRIEKVLFTVVPSFGPKPNEGIPVIRYLQSLIRLNPKILTGELDDETRAWLTQHVIDLDDLLLSGGCLRGYHAPLGLSYPPIRIVLPKGRHEHLRLVERSDLNLLRKVLASSALDWMPKEAILDEDDTVESLLPLRPQSSQEISKVNTQFEIASSGGEINVDFLGTPERLLNQVPALGSLGVFVGDSKNWGQLRRAVVETGGKVPILFLKSHQESYPISYALFREKESLVMSLTESIERHGFAAEVKNSQLYISLTQSSTTYQRVQIQFFGADARSRGGAYLEWQVDHWEKVQAVVWSPFIEEVGPVIASSVCLSFQLPSGALFATLKFFDPFSPSSGDSIYWEQLEFRELFQYDHSDVRWKSQRSGRDVCIPTELPDLFEWSGLAFLPTEIEPNSSWTTVLVDSTQGFAPGYESSSGRSRERAV